MNKSTELPKIMTDPLPADPAVAAQQENDTLACFAWEAMISDPPVATALFRALTQRQPNHGDYWAALGLALAKTNQRSEAIHAFERATELKPTNIEAWCILGELAMDELHWKKAAHALGKCLELDKQAKHPHGLRARALIKKAEKLLEKAAG